ncbi:MAG: alkaline phosphatase family protein [Solirubrobacteraceae bacterium]
MDLHSDEAEQLAAEHPDEHLRRREFLERTARTIGAGAAAAAALGPGGLVAQAAGVQRRAAPLPSPRNLPIDTFVVLMMENRSFDHYFGWVPNADVRQDGLSYVDGQGQRHATYPLAPDFQGCGHPVPGHIWEQARVQFANGKLDGFLAPGSGNDTYAIGYYRQRDLPFTPSLVREFTTCDRYFASLLASTNPNRAYAHAAQSYGDPHIFLMPGDGKLQFPTPPGFPASTMIESALARKGLRGTTFYSDDNMSSMWGPAGLRHSAPIAQFFERCGSGTLPALSFVDPQLHSFKELNGVSTDGHPVSDIRTAEAFMSDVVHAFIHSRHWRRGALFLVFDEWGGFFDHVRPPSVPDARQSPDLAKNFGQMGFRVPAVVVSPYARRGAVSHTTFGHESILKLVEYRYGLRPLTRRDARANSIGAAFNFRQRPRRPPSLPTPPGRISQPCA